MKKVTFVLVFLGIIIGCQKAENMSNVTKNEDIAVQEKESMVKKTSPQSTEVPVEIDYRAELAKFGLSEKMNAAKLFNMVLEQKSVLPQANTSNERESDMVIIESPQEISPEYGEYLLPGLKYKSIVGFTRNHKAVIEKIIAAQNAGADLMGPAYTEADIDKIELTFFYYYSKYGAEIALFYRIPYESDKNIFYINCYDDIGRKIAVYAVSYDKVLVPFSKEFFASLENETATLGGKIKISSDTENTQNDVQQETPDKKVNLKTLQESRKNKSIVYTVTRSNKTYVAEYNENGLLSKIESSDGYEKFIVTSYENGNIHEAKTGDDVYHVFTKYDKYGNWIEDQMYVGGELFYTYTRSIEYYE